jgi:hypothetical protein
MRDLLVLIACGSCFCLLGGDDLEVHLPPAKESYRKGEPVVLRLALKNTSGSALQIPFDPPYCTGLSIERRDAAEKTRDTGPSNDMMFFAVRLMSIDPGQTITVPIVLDRYITFDASGKYRLAYSWIYRPHTAGDDHVTAFRGSGEISLAIEDGAVDISVINGFLKTLYDTASAEPGDGERFERYLRRIREAVEPILWLRDDRAVDALAVAADACVEGGEDIADALARRAVTNDRARRALLNLVWSSNGTIILRYVLNACEKNGIDVPTYFLIDNLHSENTTRKIETLQYIARHGRIQLASYVSPFQEDPKPYIAALARKALSSCRWSKLRDLDQPANNSSKGRELHP